MVTAEQKSALIRAISTDPHRLSSDYAHVIGVGTRTVNKFLETDPDGQRLVQAGLMSVVLGEALFEWAKDENGERKACVGLASRPKALIVLPPPPTQSGCSGYDKQSQLIHDCECAILTTRSAKKKAELWQTLTTARDTQADMMNIMNRLVEATKRADRAEVELRNGVTQGVRKPARANGAYDGMTS